MDSVTPAAFQLLLDPSLQTKEHKGVDPMFEQTKLMSQTIHPTT